MVRVEIKFAVAKGSVLPLNNKYEISSWIYKVLSQADTKFSEWLHDVGYGTAKGAKMYKMFTFSRPFVRPFRIDKDQEGLVCLGDTVELIVSFYGDRAVQNFVVGLFKDQTFWLGTKRLRAVPLKVINVSVLPKQSFEETVVFRAQTPICLSIRNARGEEYISPIHPEYATVLTQHLTQKLIGVADHFPQLLQNINLGNGISWKLLNPQRIGTKIIKIKADTSQETKVKGYLYDFELTAPAQLMELLYYSGLGKETSQGFGFVEVLGE